MRTMIDEIWAWIALDTIDDTEGVCAFFTGTGWMPMIAADKARLDQLRGMAEQICKSEGKTLKLIKLSQRTVVETLHPESPL